MIVETFDLDWYDALFDLSMPCRYLFDVKNRDIYGQDSEAMHQVDSFR